MHDYTHVVADAHNLAHRSWWSNRTSVTSTGRDNSIEGGFCLALIGLQQRFPQSKLVLAWDGEPQRQKAKNADYKAHRQRRHDKRPADWHERLDRLRNSLGGLYTTIYNATDEADVEIARYVRQANPERLLIVSTDRDLLMLLNEQVDVLRPGQTPELYRQGDFEKEHGFPPTRYLLYKALVGDRSDNLKGVGHFPTRLAKNLAVTFRNVDDLYDSLHHHDMMPVLAQLTKNQRTKLLSAEARVRSNIGLMNLLAEDQPPHLFAAPQNAPSFRELMEVLELPSLSNALLDKPPVGAGIAQNGTTGTSEKSVGQVGPGLPLLAGWEDRLAACQQRRQQQVKPQRTIPLAPSHFLEKITFIEDAAGAQAMLDFARQRPLAYVGFDNEFRYSRPGVPVNKKHTWNDPRSIVPLLMSLVLVEPQDDGTMRLYRFVIDVRRPEVLGPLRGLFELPLLFIAHFSQGDLFCLWQLGLPVPARLWDTWAAERAFSLGLHHSRYQNEKPEDDVEEARAKEEADDQIAFNCKLVTVCLRRNVPYSFTAEKERLQQSFLTHPLDQPFTQEQIEYAAEDASAVARLYPIQAQVAIDRDCLDHLKTLEMPWTITNARMGWDGVRVDSAACQELRHACQENISKIPGELAQLGVGNVNSHDQLESFFSSIKMLDAFKVRGKYTFDDDHLEAVEDRHPVIAMIRYLRKMLRLTKDKVLTGELIGSDGRLHPEHHQLGAESGRNSMSWPNIGGIGRPLRPIVIPEEGYGIGEVDLSQIEVGIAAAVFGDPDLIRMFNGRDVYTAMGKRYYVDELPPEVQSMPDKVFKKKYREMRDRMKIFTLATIYNITPFGLSLRLDISVERATEEQNRFLSMFPALAKALREASDLGVIRGYAYLCSGLRRWRARTFTSSSWEVNWMRNTPVQGSAGVVFKAAGNRLYRRYQHYGAKLILPLHDAYIFEVPRQHLRIVAKITAEVMRSTVQEYFPELDPQVEINIDHPHCWNKDGNHRSLKLWMIRPELGRC